MIWREIRKFSVPDLRLIEQSLPVFRVHVYISVALTLCEIFSAPVRFDCSNFQALKKRFA